MKNTRLITTFFIPLALAACSLSPGKDDIRPDWVDGPSSKYPATLYLVGRGSASETDDAKDRARADLSKQFEVAIQERSRDEQHFTKTQTAEQSVESLKQSVARQLQTFSSRSIQGIEIADLWHDTVGQQHHALAILSRQKARQQFEQQIRNLDDATNQHLKQARQESDALKRAAAVDKAIKAQQQRIAVQSSLQVVDTSGRGLPPDLSLAELVRSRDALLNKVKIHPTSEGQLSAEIKNILSGQTASAGFMVSDTAAADYTLLAETRLDPPIHERGWIWLRGTLEVSLLDHSGKRVGIHRWALKASSITEARTQQRLLDDINTILRQELADTILGFVAGQ